MENYHRTILSADRSGRMVLIMVSLCFAMVCITLILKSNSVDLPVELFIITGILDAIIVYSIWGGK